MIIYRYTFPGKLFRQNCIIKNNIPTTIVTNCLNSLVYFSISRSTYHHRLYIEKYNIILCIINVTTYFTFCTSKILKINFEKKLFVKYFPNIHQL